VPRYRLHASCTTIAILAVFLLSAAAPVARGQSTATTSLRGRLAFVEPAFRRVTVLPDGESRLVELLVDEDCDVRQGDRELTLSDLVIQVGRLVTVGYRLENDRRVAESIIVEPEG
jgi:multidrug efflux pump subunit AcrA (membrane-fusion protein)